MLPDIIFVKETDSTNARVRALVLEGAPEFTAVAAQQQSAGKGRMGRRFASPPGGVYFSMLVKPEKAETMLRIMPLAALAVHRTIKELCNLECAVKWPNDLLCDGKKLCGILTEAVTAGDEISVIVGIGVDLNTVEFPPELEGIAASVYGLTGKKTDFTAFVYALYDHLCRALSGEWSVEDYRRVCVNVGRPVTLIRDGAEKSGVCLGVNDDFSLLVEYENGEKENVFYGEVSVKKT